MAEYIEREALLGMLPTDCVMRDLYAMGHNTCKNTIKRAINAMPTADVVEVRHGEWQVNVYGQHKNFRDVICPICGVNFACHTGMLQLQRFSYCPNCGAKMDGKGEGE